jgi:hypothetical protein
MTALPQYAAGTVPPPLPVTSALLRLARMVAVGLTATRILLILLLARRPLGLAMRVADLRLFRVARLVLVRVSGIRHGMFFHFDRMNRRLIATTPEQRPTSTTAPQPTADALEAAQIDRATRPILACRINPNPAARRSGIHNVQGFSVDGPRPPPYFPYTPIFQATLSIPEVFMDRFRTPLIILALGLAPFWVFIGSTSTTTINGEVVSDHSFNIAGLILGLIGVVMALQAVRTGDHSDGLRLALIVGAGLICLLQIAHSVGVISLPV